MEIERISMQSPEMPRFSINYWIAIVAASICGTNTGDLAAGPLGLGHLRGMVAIAACFYVVAIVERRSAYKSVAFYWVGIILLRTMATNVADFSTHELRIPLFALVCGLGCLMAALVVLDQRRRGGSQVAKEDAGLPQVDAFYWFLMLCAGVLGTALGDWLSDDGLGVQAWQAALFGSPIALLALWRTQRTSLSKAWYWGLIVVCRTWGTNLGDSLAHGLRIFGPRSLALWEASTISSILLISAIMLWVRRAHALQSQYSGETL